MSDVPEQTLLILGATGDLTARLLLPGLGALMAGGGTEDLLLVGSGRDDWSDDHWRKRVADSFASVGARGPQVKAALNGARFIQADVTVETDVRRLLSTCQGRLVMFFALPPSVAMEVCRVLAGIGLPDGTRLVLEKPFGTDAASAEALNDLLARLVPEDQVYRVDHYLGMATVLNILGLRFANRMLESVLNAAHVQTVDIVFDESLALEGRARYYDRAGALVDMIQSHSLQVLALLAMEAPSTLEARDFRDSKALVLRATRVWNDDASTWSRRARYTAGQIDGRPLPSYVDEDGVDPDRETETFAEVVLAVDTWRWAGVPFRVRAGKALQALRKEAVITFRQPPWVPTGLTGYDQPDQVRIGFDPDCLRLDLNINSPDDPSLVEPITLEAKLGPAHLPPYGEVLKGVFEGDPTLSVRGDTAVECWRVVDPVLQAWREDKVPLQKYTAGTTGPQEWPMPRNPHK
jgi:glucose-6-phosphate 1-dehydrogenase